MREFIWGLLKIVISALIASMIITQFVLPTTVYGVSMEPNFSHRDYLLVSKQAYRFDEPQRGDVIVFRSHLKDANGEDKILIKRVVAVAGDKVEVSDGKVYINGEEVKEDYTKIGVTNGEVAPVTVPEGAVFCLGDNRQHSTDSRHFEVGFVYDEDILGKVVFRLYPFDQIGTIGS